MSKQASRMAFLSQRGNDAEIKTKRGFKGAVRRVGGNCAGASLPMALLFCGGAIYLLWRSPRLPMFRWLDKMGLTTIVLSARSDFSEYRAHIPSLILYSLPDALWLISLLILLDRVWAGFPRVALILTSGAAVCAILLEFAQRWIPRLGTFSWPDVAVLVLASAYLTIPIRRLAQ